MNNDDIIRMAKVAERYAGEFCNGIGDTEQHHWFDAYNERFAALVAAAEREACVEVCDNLIRHGNVAEVQHRYNQAYEHCKDAIRAKGVQPPIG